jgi:hypothetical protein
MMAPASTNAGHGAMPRILARSPGATEMFVAARLVFMGIPSRQDVHEWSTDERAHVARLLDEMVDRPTVDRRPPRRRLVVVLVTCAGAVLLVPWIAFLSVSLPQSHSVRAWNVAWIGFDVALAVSLALTGWWVVQRRQLAIVGLAVAAALLVCDAWFDVCLSWNTSDQAWAIVGAAIELPIAVLMASSALRILERTSAIVRQLRGQSDAPKSIWKEQFVMLPPQ